MRAANTPSRTRRWKGSGGMARIFVVEDDAPIRNEVIEVLERQGYEASYCLAFDHVVEDILTARPDLVLLDLTLPGTDGQLICANCASSPTFPSSCLRRA